MEEMSVIVIVIVAQAILLQPEQGLAGLGIHCLGTGDWKLLTRRLPKERGSDIGRTFRCGLEQ